MSVVRASLRKMPMVYVAPNNLATRGTKIFHKSLDCRQLTKRPCRGTKHEPAEVDLLDLPRPRPCRTCYPDAPVALSVHRVCFICNTMNSGPRPCPHNGGVAVYHERVYGRPGVRHDPDEIHQRTMYVWPEHLHLYVS